MILLDRLDLHRCDVGRWMGSGWSVPGQSSGSKNGSEKRKGMQRVIYIYIWLGCRTRAGVE